MATGSVSLVDQSWEEGARSHTAALHFRVLHIMGGSGTVLKWNRKRAFINIEVCPPPINWILICTFSPPVLRIVRRTVLSCFALHRVPATASHPPTLIVHTDQYKMCFSVSVFSTCNLSLFQLVRQSWALYLHPSRRQ